MSWPEYDPNNRPFLYIHKNQNQPLKTNISSSYKKHRINFWNELIPSLQKLGGQESIKLIQYLKDSNDNSMTGYGEKEIGVFNTIQLKFLSPITSPTDLVMKNSSSSSQSVDPKKNDGLFGDLRNQLRPTNSLSDEIQSKDRTKDNQTMVTTRLTTHLTPTTTIDLLTESALGLTITLGILLLLINLIIFMSIFTCYKKITGDGDDHGHSEMISCDGDESVENHHKSMSSQSSSSHPMSAKHQLSSHPLPTQSLSFHQNSPGYCLRQCETMHRLKSSSPQSNSPSRVSITGSLPREKKVMFADLSTNHVLDATSEHIQNMTNPMHVQNMTNPMHVQNMTNPMATTMNQMSNLNQISSNLNQIPIPNQMSNRSSGIMTTVVDVSCHHHHQDPQLASDSSNCDSGITVYRINCFNQRQWRFKCLESSSFLFLCNTFTDKIFYTIFCKIFWSTTIFYTIFCKIFWSNNNLLQDLLVNNNLLQDLLVNNNLLQDLLVVCNISITVHFHQVIMPVLPLVINNRMMVINSFHQQKSVQVERKMKT